MRAPLEHGADPREEYAGILRDMRRFRLSAIGFAVVIGAVFTVLAFFGVGVAVPAAAGGSGGLVHLLHAAVAREGAPSRALLAEVAATPRVGSPRARTSATPSARRGRSCSPPSARRSSRRRVELAVDAAVESGQPLIVVTVVELSPLPLSLMLGHDQLDTPGRCGGVSRTRPSSRATAASRSSGCACGARARSRRCSSWSPRRQPGPARLRPRPLAPVDPPLPESGEGTYVSSAACLVWLAET